MRRITGKELERSRRMGRDLRVVSFRNPKDAPFRTDCPHCVENVRIAKKLGAKVIFDEENFDVVGVSMAGVTKKKLKELL